MASSVRIHAPAKVNLWLHVLAREASGYHSLETLFAATSLCDVIEVTRVAKGVELEVDGLGDTGPVEGNLVYRAATLYLAESGIREGVRLHLHKQIPAAAGLGGGSSDAAATLRALDSLFDRPLGDDELFRLGMSLGSDVPFFLGPAPFALAWGRGERLLALDPPPSREILIAHPGVEMPTPDAFRRLAAMRGDGTSPRARALSAVDLNDWDTLARLAVNDFTAPAYERIPLLREAERSLKANGAAIALLAGSGASIFGIFDEGVDPGAAASALESIGLRCWRERTLTHWPAPEARH